LGGVPFDQFHLWTTYAFQDHSLRGWKIGGGVNYAGAAPYTLIAAGAPQTLPSYTTVDLMTSYDFEAFGTALTAQLNFNNIFDRTYVTDAQAYAFASSPPYSLVTNIYGPRRSVVASLTAKF